MSSGISNWRTTGLIASANAAALLLSFLTTILMARTFGASAQMDAYTLAVSIPETLQYVLMFVTLSVVFTPLFIEVRTTHGESEAWHLALSLLALVVACVIVLLPLLIWMLPGLMVWLAPGFAPTTRALAIELTVWLLPGLLYYATVGLLLGICFAYRDFTTAALNTLFLAALNLAGFFLFVQLGGMDVHGMVMTRLAALGLTQVLVLVRTLRWKPDLKADTQRAMRGAICALARPLTRHHARSTLAQERRVGDTSVLSGVMARHLWRMLTSLPPYMFGAISGQVELVISRGLISTLGVGSVAAWGYGQRLADIPMTVLGTAFGATYLPEFATKVAEKQNAAASRQWNRALLQVTIALTPIAVLLITLGAPLIALLFQRGAFDAAVTHHSALVLAGLAIGLPLRGVGGLIVRGLPVFPSRRLPLALSALSSGATILFAFALLGALGLFGVALATSLGDILFALAGTFAFWRRMHTPDWARIGCEVGKVFFAALGAALVSFAIAQWDWRQLPIAENLARLLQVATAGLAGMGAFGFVLWALQVQDRRALLALLVPRGRQLW